MPVYDFHCANCQSTFSELRPMARCSEPAACPECGSEAPRQISAPRLAVLSTSQLQAHQRNERSAHEPRRHKHVCSSGCSHHSGDGAAKPALKQGNPGQRPWMLGH